MKKVLRYTLYKSNSLGNGGEKRSSQVSQLLSQCNLEAVTIPSGYKRSRWRFSIFNDLIRSSYLFLRILLRVRCTISIKKIIRKIIWTSGLQGAFMNDPDYNRILIYETSKLYLAFVIPYYKKLGYRLICIPHNLESLAYDNTSELSNKKSPDWLFEEIRFLKEFDFVFAISKEETLLLQQFGIKAEYLPYYPVDEVCIFLKKIREERNNRSKSYSETGKLVMLGSVVNPPTMEGMLNRIDYFSKNKLPAWELVVAGYGTDKLKKTSNEQTGITVLGELDGGKFSGLLIETDLVLIYQPPSSGTLTRILEFLIAGIPVLANFSSARDYYGTEGVYIYHNDDEMVELLKTMKFPIPAVPQVPDRELNGFKNCISDLVNS